MKNLPHMLPTVRDVLAQDRKSWPQIAKETGIPLSTIKKIRYGESKNPGVNTVEKLYVHLVQKVAA